MCEVEGCEARWPAFSRDGMAGPWRCREHDLTATRRPDEASAYQPPKPSPDPQGGLL